MGLLDILTGSLAGGGGQGSRGQQQSSGLSPIATAILALLAGRVLGGGGSGMPGNVPPGGMGRRGTNPGGPGNSPAPTNPGGGGIGDLLGGLLGGMGGRGMPGGLGGGALSGGLSDLVRQMERNGHGDTARSWVGRGENRRIAPEELEQALGPDNVDSLAEQAGISRIGLLSGLSEQLPDVVDQLTPEGRLPTDEEAEHLL